MTAVNYTLYNKDGSIFRTGLCPNIKHLHLMADPLQEQYVVEGRGSALNEYVNDDFEIVPLRVPKPKPQNNWQYQRHTKYPPVTMYLDAQVKLLSGDPDLMVEGQSQLDAYVALCLNTKKDIPKPKKNEDDV